MTLAREAREQGWWTQYDDLRLDPYIGLEQVATSITAYAMYYMPALLQTEEYARAIIKGIAPRIGQEILQQRVEARLRRQQLLQADDRPRYRVLLDEAVLRRPVGGPQVMAAQLGRVLQVERKGTVTAQVIPFNIGAQASADVHFVLLDFAEESNLSPVVFIEGLVSNQYFEKKADIARYRETIELLRDSALSPRDSVALVDEYRKMNLGRVVDPAL
jgi:hypothetical protein